VQRGASIAGVADTGLGCGCLAKVASVADTGRGCGCLAIVASVADTGLGCGCLAKVASVPDTGRGYVTATPSPLSCDRSDTVLFFKLQQKRCQDLWTINDV
jgi:hypothetical protein